MAKWIVYDNEEGLVLITDNYEKALSEYENHKSDCERYVDDWHEFSTNERVILAKLEKEFFSNFLYIENEGENEGEEVWEFKEEIY